MITATVITKTKEDNMSKIPAFSIDACADILNVSQDNRYKKCLSVYVLADDLIESRYDWLTEFLSPNLSKALKKMKTPVRRGALLRGIKMAIESSLNGAQMQEVCVEKMPDFMSHSARAYDVSWVSCPEVKLKFSIESRDIPKGACVCLDESDCFKNGVAVCMTSQIIPPAKLAAEYDIFYHTRYPDRAKEFEQFVNKVIQLNHLPPIKIAGHDDSSHPTNGMEYTKD